MRTKADLSWKCQRCGSCCKGGAWLRNMVHRDDIERWRSLGREDVLKDICPCCGRLIDPDNGDEPWRKEECPFLDHRDGKAFCVIYDVRPKVCRDFPVRACSNPECPEKFHFHDWLWHGKCKAAAEFRRDLVRSLEGQIRISDE